ANFSDASLAGGPLYYRGLRDGLVTSGSVHADPETLLQDGVFQGLGRAQAHHGLRLDLDCFAGLGIAAHARLAMRLDHAPDSRDDELTSAALGFFHRQLVQLFKKQSYLLFRCAELVGDVRNDLGLAEWLGCHLVCLSSYNFFASRGTRGERGIS